MRMRRWYRTDYLLWAGAGLVTFTGLGFLDVIPDSGQPTLWSLGHRLVAGPYADPVSGWSMFGFWALALAAPAALAGWLLQATAVVCGVRLSGRVSAEEAADYADRVPAEPARAPDRGGH